MTIEVADFEQEVLEESRRKPVLVDFWAPWCGPCRVLGPVLEKLAGEASGSWMLAKVNTDENPEVSMRFGIRGIPAVKLFVDGSVAAEFTGALPEYAVRKWLDEHLPSAEKSSLAQAASLLSEGRFAEARDMLEDIDSDEARILLARLIVFADPTRATELLNGVEAPDPESRAIVESIRGVASVLSTSPGDLPEGPGKEIFSSVAVNLRAGRFEDAASALVTLLKEDRYYGEDAARRLGIALFTLLGPEHPATRSHRRLFDMYLY